MQLSQLSFTLARHYLLIELVLFLEKQNKNTNKTLSSSSSSSTTTATEKQLDFTLKSNLKSL